MEPGDVLATYPIRQCGRVGEVGNQVFAHTRKNQSCGTGDDHKQHEAKRDHHIDIAEQFYAAIHAAHDRDYRQASHCGDQSDLNPNIRLEIEHVTEPTSRLGAAKTNRCGQAKDRRDDGE